MSGKTNESREDSGEINPERPLLIRELNGIYGLSMGEYLSASRLEELLAERLNTLIRDDFSGLVRLLYRIDVDEAKLKQLLLTGQGTDTDAGNNTRNDTVVDAGTIIARLVIERQLQKIATRKTYANNKASPAGGENDCGEEKW